MDILSLLRNSPGAQAWLAQQAPASALAAVGISPREALDREMSYDGSHPRQQEQAARDHFRSYGPNMLMDALIPGYGAGGDAKAASEAYGEGRYGAAALSAGMAAADFLPFLSVLPAAAKGIRAFHGSPHDFDRFDMSKIGTGEGAQAYGHGLYFAENEGVAREYRDALSPGVLVGGAPYGLKDKLVADKIKAGMSPAEALKASADEMDRMAAQYEAAGSASRAQSYRDASARLRADDPSKYVPATGRMYEVNINADPEAFLDWDKPLSEQSEGVLKAIPRTPAMNAPEIMEPYDLLNDLTEGKYNNPLNAAKARGASQKLLEAGIPGIKYLDAGSRGAGDGSRNYVVFDDRLITILRKYGIGGLIAGGGAYALTDAEYAQAAELLAQDGMNTGAQ